MYYKHIDLVASYSSSIQQRVGLEIACARRVYSAVYREPRAGKVVRHLFRIFTNFFFPRLFWHAWKMTMLLRKMWKTHSKHKKLCEEWALAECEGEGWWREARDSGPGEVDVRYAGAAPVERAASAPATALAVRSALHSAKLLNKKLQRVNLDISAKGIVVTDADSQENVISVSIYRISYCSADAANARVFAVVEGRPAAGLAENHVVHAFVCTRRKHARALALSLAHAFNDAYQAWQANLNQGSSLGSDNKRLAPWVRFQEESDEEELDSEDWQSPAPLVTFA